MSEEPKEEGEIKFEIGICGRGIVVLKMTFDNNEGDTKYLQLSPTAAIDLAISITQTAVKALEEERGVEVRLAQ